MTRWAQGPREPGLGPELDETQVALERYASETADYPPRELADRVMRAVDAEPTPRRGLLAALFLSRPGGPTATMRLALVVATVMAAAVLALAAGGISQLLQRNVGSSPSQAVTQSVAPSASDEPSVTPTPSPTPSATPDLSSAPASVSPSAGSAAPSQSAEASPTGSDEHESETPEATRTPRPSETPDSDS